MKNTKILWFTMIELIVVMVILTILWIIWLVSMNDHWANVRNSARTEILKNTETQLINYKINTWSYPIPDDAVEITHSWALIWTQWVFGKKSAERLKLSDNNITDPETKNLFTYSITNNRKEFSLAWVLEVPSWIITDDSFKAIVTWDYNGEMIAARISWVNTILSIFSIVATDISSPTLSEIISGKYFVYDWFTNLPHSFSDFYIVSNWNDFASKNLVLFSWDLMDLNDRNTRLILLENIRLAYLWLESLQNSDRAEKVLSTIIDMENPDSNLIDFTCDTVEYKLKYPIECNNEYFYAFYFDAWITNFADVDFSWINWDDIHYIFYEWWAWDYMWVWTDDWLSVYDFDIDDWIYIDETNYLIDDNVKEIVEDSNWNIWVATKEWISKYGFWSWLPWTWTNYHTWNSTLPDEEVVALAIDSNGDIWAWTDDWIAIYDISADAWLSPITEDNSGLVEDDITDIIMDSNWDMWIWTDKWLSVYDTSLDSWITYTKQNSDLSHNDITSLLQDSSWEYWIGTSNWLNNLTWSTWTKYTKNNSWLESSHINSVFEYSDWTLWIATDKWLTKYDWDSWFSYTKKDNDLPWDKVYYMYSDSWLIILWTNKWTYYLQE